MSTFLGFLMYIFYRSWFGGTRRVWLTPEAGFFVLLVTSRTHLCLIRVYLSSVVHLFVKKLCSCGGLLFWTRVFLLLRGNRFRDQFIFHRSLNCAFVLCLSLCGFSWGLIYNYIIEVLAKKYGRSFVRRIQRTRGSPYGFYIRCWLEPYSRNS